MAIDLTVPLGASTLDREDEDKETSPVELALSTSDEDIDVQTRTAFGELSGYEEATEYESRDTYRQIRDENSMDSLMQGYLASGEDYYSEDDLNKMSEEERYNILVEERDNRNKEAMIQEYVASNPELQDQQSIQVKPGITVEVPKDETQHNEAYLRTLDFQTLTDILYNEDRDLVNKYTENADTSNEFVLEAVPKAIAPYVRVTGKGNGFVVVKPLAEIEDKVQENVLEQLRTLKSEEISEGAELKEYVPTKRESSQAFVAGVLQSVGMFDDGRKAMQYASRFTGTRDTMGVADFLGVGAVFGADEAIDDIGRINRSEDASYGDYIAPSAVLGLSTLEALPYVGLAAKGLKRVITAAPTPSGTAKAANETVEEVGKVVDDAVANDAARAARSKNKLRIADAKNATDSVKQEQAINSAQTAKENADISDDLIRAYEDQHGVSISKTVEIDGEERLAIDYTKVRGVSQTHLDDVDTLPDDTLNDAAFSIDGYRNPVLNPDKYDAVVSVVAETKKLHPDAFEGAENTIEGLFNALVKKKLVLTDEFTEIMGKYGLNLDDVVRLSIGSVSRSAKIMRKHQTMKRLMGMSDAARQQKKMDEATQNFSSVSKYIRRGENIIRGLMVSNFATAARNFTTTLIQFPIEGLTATFDSALLAAGKNKGLSDTLTDMNQSFRNSFSMYGRTFSDPLEMKDYVEFILKEGGTDGLKMFNRFYDQISEIQKFTGRGAAKEAQIARLMQEQKMSRKEATKVASQITSGKLAEKTGKILDGTFSEVEDFVSFLNIPNRFQEHISRHTFFLQRIEDQVKKHYDMDFFEMVNNGKMGDLWNNAVPGVPKNAPKFNEIMADATDYAMRRTFAAPPETKAFQTALRVLNRIPGSTLVLPFPRFMFGAMEYMAAVTPYQALMFTGKAAGRAVRGKKIVDLSVDNTEKIARSMTGTLVLGSMYAAADEFITRDNKIRVGDKLIDPSPAFPLAQMSWIAKGARIYNSEGPASFNDWFRGTDFVQLFSGQNIKMNTGLGEIIDDWVAFLSGEAKIGAGEQLWESIGSWFGNVATRPLQPMQMYFDAQRLTGNKSTTLKSYASDPDMTIFGSFGQGFSEVLKKRGFVSSEEEAAAPTQAYTLSPDGKQYKYAGYKLALGLNVMDKYPAYKEFFLQYDLRDYDFSSRTRIGTVDNAINDVLSGIMPSIAVSMATLERDLLQQGRSKDYIRKQIRARTMQLVGNVKSTITQRAGRAAGADNVPFVQALLSLRTFNADAQKAMLMDFENVMGRPADLSNAADLQGLLRIGKRSKYKQNLLE